MATWIPLLTLDPDGAVSSPQEAQEVILILLSFFVLLPSRPFYNPLWSFLLLFIHDKASFRNTCCWRSYWQQ